MSKVFSSIYFSFNLVYISISRHRFKIVLVVILSIFSLCFCIFQDNHFLKEKKKKHTSVIFSSQVNHWELLFNFYFQEAVLRWRRNIMGRPVSPPQIH